MFQFRLPLVQGAIDAASSFAPDHSSSHDMAARMEQVLTITQDLNGAPYLLDIDFATPSQRQQAGFSPTCIIWPNAEDQLERLPRKTPDLHFPFAYKADQQFGAAFACHLQDINLHLINLLHLGRKIWITVPPAYAIYLDEKLQTSGLFPPPQFAQFVRHDAIYISCQQLEEWDIPYTLIDQRAQQMVITVPQPIIKAQSRAF